MHLAYRTTCRVCGSSGLKKVVDLGEQHIQGVFFKPGFEAPPMRKIPLSLVRCDPTEHEGACGLLQTSCSVPSEILYTTYWYRSGTNTTMREHLRGITEEVVELLDRDKAQVLDIGCNDGTQLSYYPSTYERYGIDPSNAAKDLLTDMTIVQDTFPSEALAQTTNGAKFDAITSIAMFYDLEDPVAFVRAIKEALTPDGLWIFEMSYMPSMLENTSYDTICHEHLEYYSLAVLEFILERADMRLFRVALNDSNGGSIRCYATHRDYFGYQNADFQETIRRLRLAEFDLKLDTDEPYRDFQARVDRHREQLVQIVKECKGAGKSIHVYGASTKGNTILQFCRLDNTHIDCAADRNPDKHGARTLGSEIPIVSEKESRAMRPDFYLVLPWHFRAEFLERERQTLASGTSMIFPLPEVEVVHAGTR
jgi:SAM-dependent methyltransferase